MDITDRQNLLLPASFPDTKYSFPAIQDIRLISINDQLSASHYAYRMPNYSNLIVLCVIGNVYIL